MSIERQTVTALKWTALAKFTGQLVTWVTTLVVIRILAPADYGLMAIVSVFITVLAAIAELGLGASLVQSAELDEEDIAAMTGLVIVGNLAIGAVVALGAPLIAWFYDEPRLTNLIRVASLAFVFNAFTTMPQALAYRSMNFKWVGIVEFVAVVLSGVVTLILAWTGAGVWALVIGSQLQNGVRALMLFRQGTRPVFRFQGVRRYLVFGGATTLNRFLVQIVYQSDIFIGGRLLTSQAMGLYSVSVHLATLPMQKIMSVINQVAFPAVARLQHDVQRLRGRLLDATRLLMAVSIGVLWGVSAVAPEFVQVVLGEKWLPAVYPLQVVCLVVPIRMLSMFFSTAALGVGDIRVNMYHIAVSSLVLPISFYVGVRWGAAGLATGWVVALPIIFAANIKRMLKSLGIRVMELMACMRGSVAAGIAMYIAVYVAREALTSSVSSAARFSLLILVGAVAYLGALWLADRGIVGEFRRVLSALRS